MKYGLAPTIKQAFEEIYKAPFIAKILLAELGTKAERDLFLTINYDGNFEESRRWAALGATPAVQTRMGRYLESQPGFVQASLSQAVEIALCAWAVGRSPKFSWEATDASLPLCLLRRKSPTRSTAISGQGHSVRTCTTDRRREVSGMYSIGAQWAGVIEISRPPSR